MTREVTGAPRWNATKQVWEARVWRKGERKRDAVAMPGIAREDVERAKRMAKIIAMRLRGNAVVPVESTETVAEFSDRWLASREGNVASVRDNRGHLTVHILPVLGAHTMLSIGRQEIEALVTALDGKVAMREISGNTAANIWGTCSKLFSDAAHSKPGTGLRCLPSNPCDGVRGPEGGTQKLLQFLYPSEFSAFVECAHVPMTWRRNVAIATYLCLRDGEQRALKWDSVDLRHGVVALIETYDRRTFEEKEGTKSGVARHVPIPEALMPLLLAMRAETEGEGHVCYLPSLRDMARGLRRWLHRAGVDRSQLHDATTVSRPIRWHDLRATGLTWHAVKGESPATLRDIAGHTQTAMTDRYVRAAGLLRSGRFGQVFPALPAALSLPGSSGPQVAYWAGETSQTVETTDAFWRGGRDSKAFRDDESRSEITVENRGERPSSGESAPPNSNQTEPPIAPSDPVERVLVEAIRTATTAGAWDVVIRLADELQARRVAGSATNVVAIGSEKRGAK